MTLDRAWPLQVAVFEAVSSAADGWPVFNYPPEPPPDQYIRIDGFSAFDISRWKTRDTFRHSFMVHAFDHAGGNARSLASVVQRIGLIHTAILAAVLDANAQRVKVEVHNSSFDKDAAGGHTAHALTRYSLQI